MQRWRWAWVSLGNETLLPLTLLLSNRLPDPNLGLRWARPPGCAPITAPEEPACLPGSSCGEGGEEEGQAGSPTYLQCLRVQGLPLYLQLSQLQ